MTAKPKYGNNAKLCYVDMDNFIDQEEINHTNEG